MTWWLVEKALRSEPHYRDRRRRPEAPARAACLAEMSFEVLDWTSIRRRSTRSRSSVCPGGGGRSALTIRVNGDAWRRAGHVSGTGRRVCSAGAGSTVRQRTCLQAGNPQIT